MSYILREKMVTLILSAISFVLNLCYYCNLQKIITTYNLTDQSDYHNGLFINGKKAIEILTSYGFDNFLLQCLFGLILLVLMFFIFWNCSIKYLYDVITDGSDEWLFIITICLINVMNIILTIFIAKWLLVLWIILFLGSFYSAATSKGIS